MLASSASTATVPILAAFEGERVPRDILDAVAAGLPGVTLYRSLNVRSAAQLRELTGEVHGVARRAGLPPPIVSLDQEGGQLIAVGDGTPFPGNLALAATGSPDLAEAVGRATGRELAALGVTVNFAPDCDLLTNRDNPAVGVRSFGDDPEVASRLAARFVVGHQSAGVATTAKHFPGGGDRAEDSHYALPIVHHGLERLRRVELPPFQGAIAAGCRLVMAAHLALPEVDGLAGRPTMVSLRILIDLLRHELGFRGVVVSDALDMGAVDQSSLVEDVVEALVSGVDLLLAGPAHAQRGDLLPSIAQGLRGSVGSAQAGPVASARRIDELRHWLRPAVAVDLSEVGSVGHRALALEVARRSVTLVRDRDELLPLSRDASGRALVIVPRPVDLTPADTSSVVRIELAARLREAGFEADEMRVSIDPDDAEVGAIRARLGNASLAILASINARQHRGQARIVEALLQAGVPVIAVALRMPDDLEAYPDVGTYLCTYSIQPPAIEALAEVLTGALEPIGKLPLAGIGA
jgi:beta-N-acetylhexosaminidase